MINARQSGVLAGFAAASLVVATVCSTASAVTIEADVLQADNAYGSVTCNTSVPGAATVAFSGSFMDSGGISLSPSSADPAKRFVGDFTAAGISSVSFTVQNATGGTVGSSSTLTLITDTRMWTIRVSALFPTVAGGVATNRISLRREDGWNAVILAGEDPDQVWQSSLASVTRLSLDLAKGSGPVTLTISGVSIDGDRAIVSLTPLQDALMARFGVTDAADVSADQAAIDSDGDGMSDLAEILSVHDAAFYATTAFKARADSTDAGIVITWGCKAGAVYKVLRTSDLRVGGSFVEGAEGVEVVAKDIVATETGYMYITDPETNGSNEYFYRVILQ